MLTLQELCVIWCTLNDVTDRGVPTANFDSDINRKLRSMIDDLSSRELSDYEIAIIAERAGQPA